MVLEGINERAPGIGGQRLDARSGAFLRSR
jgi:hypothetical protein